MKFKLLYSVATPLRALTLTHPPARISAANGIVSSFVVNLSLTKSLTCKQYRVHTKANHIHLYSCSVTSTLTVSLMAFSGATPISCGTSPGEQTCQMTFTGDYDICDEVSSMLHVTSVKAKEPLVAQDLLGTVKAVLVHQLSYEGPGGALVLHTGFHQVDGVHSGSTRSCRHTHRFKSIHPSKAAYKLRNAKQQVSNRTSSDGAEGKPVRGLRCLHQHRPGSVSM